jgi:hypothetical protein
MVAERAAPQRGLAVSRRILYVQAAPAALALALVLLSR